MDGRQNSRNGILSLTIKDKAVLYSAYMPFLQNGGLFVPTNKAYSIGDEVFMLLTLMDEPEKIPIAGKVVWIAGLTLAGGTVLGGLVGARLTVLKGHRWVRGVVTVAIIAFAVKLLLE